MDILFYVLLVVGVALWFVAIGCLDNEALHKTVGFWCALVILCLGSACIYGAVHIKIDTQAKLATLVETTEQLK